MTQAPPIGPDFTPDPLSHGSPGGGSGVAPPSSAPGPALPNSGMLDQLQEVELLRGVELEFIEPLVRQCPILELAEGETLIRAGEPNENLYILLEGRLEVRLEPGDQSLRIWIEPGESVGEMSVIDRQPSSASVVAGAASRVLTLDEELLWLLVNTSHAVSANLLLVLSRRLRHGNSVISSERRQSREYQFQATVDSLTELFNRHWFDRVLPRQLERSQGSGESLVLLMVDVDRFKRVNDRLGHLAGDQVLRTVAARIRESIRALDVAARYGGEEFALLCPDSSLADGIKLAERLRAAISGRPFEIGRESLEVTVSVGVAEMWSSATTAELIGSADRALYQAKADGRNCVRFAPVGA